MKNKAHITTKQIYHSHAYKEVTASQSGNIKMGIRTHKYRMYIARISGIAQSV